MLVSLPCACTLLYIEESKIKIPPHGILFCTKTLNYQLGFSSVFLKIWPWKQFDVTTAQTTQQKKKLKKFKKRTHTGCMRSRLPTSFEEKAAGFLVYCISISEIWYQKQHLQSAKLSLQGFSKDNTLLLIHGFSFYHKWNLNSRCSCGTWTSFWKNKKKNKVTLMSAILRLSLTCAVSNVGDVPAHQPMHTTG